ncbi:hypothetical protein HYC85_002336, partial [Camellia sinensis]
KVPNPLTQYLHIKDLHFLSYQLYNAVTNQPPPPPPPPPTLPSLKIRKRKYSIGEKVPNPLTQDLHFLSYQLYNAVTNLSYQLYIKDLHFLMELIQNAESNEHSPGVEPALEFVLTNADITELGSPATLLVFNNEVGFAKDNIESLCSIGRSTKTYHGHKGFTGEKGDMIPTYHPYSKRLQGRSSMPVVDACGNVSLCTSFLVPTSRSIWVKLFGSSKIFTEELELENDEMIEEYDDSYPMNKEDEAYSCQKYVELGEVYGEAAEFAGEYTPENELLNFLIKHAKATDLPDILPQDSIGTENMNQLIIDHLKPLVSSEMSGHLGFSMLSFIRYSNDNNKLDVDLLKTLQVGKWLKTNQGYVTPRGAVYLASDIGEAILQITDLWVIDKTYYGSQLSGFVHELKLIGIIVDPEDVYKLIPEHFKFPKDLSKVTKDVVLLLLECIRHLGSAVVDLTKKITYQPWMKTSFDFRCPSECLLPDKNWGYLVVVPLPIIDEVYYWKQEAVLPDATGLANDLCKMIKMGFEFEFTEDEVDSLLVSENLELYAVDTNFLECAFPAVKVLFSCVEHVTSSKSYFKLSSSGSPITPHYHYLVAALSGGFEMGDVEAVENDGSGHCVPIISPGCSPVGERTTTRGRHRSELGFPLRSNMAAKTFDEREREREKEREIT